MNGIVARWPNEEATCQFNPDIPSDEVMIVQRFGFTGGFLSERHRCTMPWRRRFAVDSKIKQARLS
ncbi:hypothetical protein [Acidihalobacter ferrooxydans]|uniref:hypothetical protein n=1 Tax=Acidihalobacter ferrooxydans TaxID=1765967 RepID=UPI0012EC9191|nr:hypothetical protein [Acidihalobacter ferrooxydans]